jgi:hypothetical protein
MQAVGLILLSFFLVSLTQCARATVTVNEISPMSDPDWVELYNDSSESADLAGFRLRDSTETNKRDLTGQMLPYGYSVIQFGNLLNNKGDTVRLLQITGDGEIMLEEVTFGENGSVCMPDEGGTIGRQTDGRESFVVLGSATPGNSNSGSPVVPCASPTSVPAHSPKPSHTTAPTVKPDPTATVIAEVTKIPSAPDNSEVPPRRPLAPGVSDTARFPESAASVAGYAVAPSGPGYAPERSAQAVIYIALAKVLLVIAASGSAVSAGAVIRNIV